MVPFLILKLIPDIDNHLFHDIQKGNKSLFLRNYVLYMPQNLSQLEWDLGNLKGTNDMSIQALIW